MLFALRESLNMLREEGLQNVFKRHERHGEATRRAVKAWGLENVALDPKEYSNSVTAVYTPAGHSADAFRKVVLERFNMALGSGLGKLADKVFRIGHLADLNDLMLAGALSGVEMGLELAGVPSSQGRRRRGARVPGGIAQRSRRTSALSDKLTPQFPALRARSPARTRHTTPDKPRACDPCQSRLPAPAPASPGPAGTCGRATRKSSCLRNP